MSNDYEQRAVAFIDILGFSGMVKGIESTSADYNMLFNALAKLKTYEEIVSNTESVHSRLVVSAFSDCITISSKPEHIMSILRACGFFFRDLLQSGVALRGGIATGKLHHANGIVFGEAFLEAYRLETKVAMYPRIVISAEALKLVSDWDMQFIKRDRDGLYYVNIFAFNTTQPGDDSCFVEGYNHRAEYLSQVKQKIESNIALARELDHKAKWHWLACQFNEAVEVEAGELGGEIEKIIA